MLIYRQARVSRDIDVTEIPAGTPTKLAAGTQVVVMQQVGGAYTVMTPDGMSFRVAGTDGDAIGEKVIEPPPLPASIAAGGPADEAAVLEVMKTVYDPEIPVNIVDLGLVYDCKLRDVEGGKKAEIKMTLTAPGCGMGNVLKMEVEQKVRALPGVKEADVQLVWDPPWDRSRMSESAKLELGFF